MREPHSNYMRVGLVHFMAYPQVGRGQGPVLETLEELLADEFFDAVEITGIDDKNTRVKARDLLRSSGTVVAYGAQPTIIGRKLLPGSTVEAERRRAEEVLLDELELAHSLGAGAMAVMSGPDPGRGEREKALDALGKTVDSLCRRASELGMRIVLETFDRDVDKRSLLGPSREAARFAGAVKQRRPDFGIMLDLSHLPLLGEGPAEAVEALSDCLVHVHIGNCVTDSNHPAYGDSHPRFGLPGGANDIAELTEFLRVLLDSGYLDPVRRPIVSFEVKPLENESSRVVIAQSKRALIEAWARV